MYKVCKKCGKVKDLELFKKASNNKDGRAAICKECVKVSSSIYYSKNKIQLLDKQKQARKENPNKFKIIRKSYYLNNKEKELSANKCWADSHRDVINAREKVRRNNPEYKAKRNKQARNWLHKHPEKNNEYHSNRRALEFGNGGKVSAKDWKTLLSFYGHRCLACGSVYNITKDHIVPLKLGGKHVISNIQPLCVSCNSKKKLQIIDYRPFPYVSEIYSEGQERTWIEV